MTTTSCPLLHKLPPELRLKIYEFALAQDSDIELTYLEAQQRLVRTRPLPLGPLACINRHQIQNESLPVFTSINYLKIATPILGQYIKLVQCQPVTLLWKYGADSQRTSGLVGLVCRKTKERWNPHRDLVYLVGTRDV